VGGARTTKWARKTLSPWKTGRRKKRREVHLIIISPTTKLKTGRLRVVASWHYTDDLSSSVLGE